MYISNLTFSKIDRITFILMLRPINVAKLQCGTVGLNSILTVYNFKSLRVITYKCFKFKFVHFIVKKIEIMCVSY